MSNILQDLSLPAISLAMDANHLAYYQLFTHLPQTIFHDDPEILWFETGIRHDVFNRMLQTHLHHDTSTEPIERVRSYFRQGHIPFLWHIGPTSSPTNLGSILTDYGLTHYETEPGIAVDLLTINEDIPALELTIQSVTTHEQLEQWIRVWEIDSSEEVIRLWLTFYSSLHLNLQSPLRLYLGTLNGEPVATSGVFFGGGVASIGPVGTLPIVRQQGIGASMTLHALREARKQGYRIGVLTASPMGINIYRRIGFREYCTFSIYLWHPKY